MCCKEPRSARRPPRVNGHRMPGTKQKTPNRMRRRTGRDAEQEEVEESEIIASFQLRLLRGAVASSWAGSARRRCWRVGSGTVIEW